MVQGCENGECGTCCVCMHSKRTTFCERLRWFCVAIGFAMCICGLFNTFDVRNTHTYTFGDKESLRNAKDLFTFDPGATLHIDDSGKLSVLRQIPGLPGSKGECSIPQQLLDRLQTVELELPILRKRLQQVYDDNKNKQELLFYSLFPRITLNSDCSSLTCALSA